MDTGLENAGDFVLLITLFIFFGFVRKDSIIPFVFSLFAFVVLADNYI